ERKGTTKRCSTVLSGQWWGSNFGNCLTGVAVGCCLGRVVRKHATTISKCKILETIIHGRGRWVVVSLGGRFVVAFQCVEEGAKAPTTNLFLVPCYEPLLGEGRRPFRGRSGGAGWIRWVRLRVVAHR